MINSDEIGEKALKIIEQMGIRGPKFIPSKNAFSRIIDFTFWCSLEKYEGNPLKVRIFFAPEEVLNSYGFVRLDEAIPISIPAIRQLSPAQCFDGGLIAIENENSAILIAGFLGSFPSVFASRPLWLCVESRAIGVVRISYSHRPIVEFKRGETKQLGGMSFDRDFAALLLNRTGLFPGETVTALNFGIPHALLDIMSEIEENGHGGAIWILPAGVQPSNELIQLGKRAWMHSDWWEPYKEKWEMRSSSIQMARQGGSEFMFCAAQEHDHLRLRAIRRTIASLAGVDGAILMNGSPEILAFSVVCNKFSYPATKVIRANNRSRLMTGVPVDKSDFGGSRHQSAIDFCSSNHPAGALVASHDGGLTVFASLEKGSVIGSKISVIPSDLVYESSW